MIPVTLQPEPTQPIFDFDSRVRQPGQNWLVTESHHAVRSGG